MHTFIGLLVATAAACAFAVPPGPTPPMPELRQLTAQEISDDYLKDYLLPRMLNPNHFGKVERAQPESGDQDLLNKEIERLSQLVSEEEPLPPPVSLLEDEVTRWMAAISYVEQPYEGPMGLTLRRFVPRDRLVQQNIQRMAELAKGMHAMQGMPESAPSQPQEEPEKEEEEEKNIEELKEVEEEEKNIEESKEVEEEEKNIEEPKEVDAEEKINEQLRITLGVIADGEEEEISREEPNSVATQTKNETFALTPLDEGFFEPAQKIIAEKSNGPHEGGESEYVELTPPRETRQNPNLGRTKNLVAENMGLLRTGFTMQAPGTTVKPHHHHVLDNDPADPIYSMALITAIGSALAMTIAGFAFGWYTLAKRAKAAADVDYPAYGVTGPTVDSSGDRKLAHSAHMYHYQHQKQQIIAMEKNCLEQRNGSMSDPESEEENEEGDYTVYECPGFATTGEMEVKNPLFSEDPTPPTPGKCELVKPQPKD